MPNVRPPPPQAEDGPAATPPGEEGPNRGNDADNVDPEIINLSRRLYEVELHAFERNKGALRVSAHGPTDLSILVATEIYWQGMTEKSESYLRTRHEYRARVHRDEHASFGMYLPSPPRVACVAAFIASSDTNKHGCNIESYWKKKYMKALPADTHWAFRDDEDSTLLDVECYTYYESESCPGTVTLEGFGLECWDAIESHTISVPVSYAPLPTIPMPKLLRRVDELRKGDSELGRDSEKDLRDLSEMLGDEG
jgi:hypothetical protein